MNRQEIMTRLKALIQAHPKGRMVSGFTVYETAMSDCVFSLGETEACIEKDYPASFRLVLQLEGPYGLPPRRVRNTAELRFLTEEECSDVLEQVSALLDGADLLDQEALEKFVAEWRAKNTTRRR